MTLMIKPGNSRVKGVYKAPEMIYFQRVGEVKKDRATSFRLKKRSQIKKYTEISNRSLAHSSLGTNNHNRFHSVNIQPIIQSHREFTFQVQRTITGLQKLAKFQMRSQPNMQVMSSEISLDRISPITPKTAMPGLQKSASRSLRSKDPNTGISSISTFRPSKAHKYHHTSYIQTIIDYANKPRSRARQLSPETLAIEDDSLGPW
jgi:hypothetical protein